MLIYDILDYWDNVILRESNIKIMEYGDDGILIVTLLYYWDNRIETSGYRNIVILKYLILTGWSIKILE